MYQIEYKHLTVNNAFHMSQTPNKNKRHIRHNRRLKTKTQLKNECSLQPKFKCPR